MICIRTLFHHIYVHVCMQCVLASIVMVYTAYHAHFHSTLACRLELVLPMVTPVRGRVRQESLFAPQLTCAIPFPWQPHVMALL